MTVDLGAHASPITLQLRAIDRRRAIDESAR
jgi:hypothetical protein